MEKMVSMELSKHENNQDYKNFWSKWEQRACLVSNLHHKTRKIRTRTQHMWNNNPTKIYYEKETKQGYDKKTYPKLVWNILNIKGNYTSIYTYWAPSSKNFKKKLPTYIWPMCTHVWPMCTHVWIMSYLKVN
jgi:hypothetical protein